jgi:hypothetical protein
MRAPRPGVKARASHPKYWSGPSKVRPAYVGSAERVKVTIRLCTRERCDLYAFRTSYESQAGLGAEQVNLVDSALHERAIKCAGGAL